jgi:hypothetical protein
MMIRVCVIVCLFCLACKNKVGLKVKHATWGESPTAYYPFSPREDINFKKGNTQLSEIVLNVWKGYEAGNVKSLGTYFADSAIMVFHDRQLSGKTDTVLQQYQRMRDKYMAVQCHIDYWQPVFDENRKEYWVLLWAKTEGTLQNRKIDSWSVQQVWKFNQQNKIYFMQQFDSQFWW